RRVLLIFVGAVLLIVTGIIGARYGLYALSHESTDNAYVEAHITAISPKVVGHVVKVYVDDNRLVKKGELLVEIDPRDYETQLERAQANVQTAMSKQKSAHISVGL